MTEEQLAFAAERLANAQEKFVEGVRLVVDAQIALVQRLRVFEDFLNISQELKGARDDEAKRTLDSFQALVKAFIESNVNLREKPSAWIGCLPRLIAISAAVRAWKMKIDQSAASSRPGYCRFALRAQGGQGCPRSERSLISS